MQILAFVVRLNLNSDIAAVVVLLFFVDVATIDDANDDDDDDETRVLRIVALIPSLWPHRLVIVAVDNDVANVLSIQDILFLVCLLLVLVSNGTPQRNYNTVIPHHHGRSGFNDGIPERPYTYLCE